MKNSDITQTVVRYLMSRDTSEAKRIENIMPEKRYILTNPGSGLSSKNRRFVHGTGIDVLADMIENKEFFGDYVSHTPEQADNCNNGGFSSLGSNPIDVFPNTAFKVRTTPRGLIVVTESVPEKSYLANLRTKEGFIGAAELLGFEDGVEERAKLIYS